MASWCVTRTLRRSYLKAGRINTSRNGIHVYEHATSTLFTSTPPGKKSRHTLSKRLLYAKSLPGLVHEASYGNRVDEDLSRILEAQTIERVFENLFLSDTLTPQLITAAFTTLADLLTKQLLSFPWTLHNKYSMIHIQSFFSSETRELYQQVNDNSEFKRLCSEANKCRQDFTNGQLVAVTQSVLKLMHLNIKDSTFFGLFIECQRRQDEFDLEELVAYSSINNLMRRNGFYVNAWICERFQRLRLQLEQNVNEKSFKNIIDLFYYTSYFMTGEQLDEIQEWLCELSTEHQELTFSWFLQIFDSATRFSNSINPKLLSLMYNRFEKHFEEVTAEELFRMRMYIKDYNNCPPPVILKMKERADRLLSQSEELKSSEVIFLCSVYDCLRHPGDSLTVLEDALIPRIDTMDITLLQYLSSTSIMFITQRADLLQSFFNHILKLKMEIFGSISCLVSIANCVSKMRKIKRNRSFEQWFSRQLMFYFKNRYLGTGYSLSIARSLILSLDYFDTQTIESFHEKLLNIIPNISLNEILFTASTFPKVVKRYDYTPSFAKYQPEHYPSVLISSLAGHAIMRKDELKNLMQVNQWVSILDSSNSSFIQQNNKQVCEMYAKYAETLDYISIQYSSYILKRFRLNVPEVLDRISSTLLTSSSFLNLANVTKSIELLAFFDHNNCDDIEDLSELYLNKINQLGNKWESYVGVIVAGANHFATLQSYSEKLLSLIFSLDFLRKLDESIENDPNNSRKHYVKTMFLELNRSVLLQCLHIPVPWISRPFSWKSFKLYEFITKSWQICIYEGLLHLLGGVDYVKVGPLTTAYGHLYDYECALDINRVPVPVDSPETHYKIAVLLLKPNNFSANDYKLSGPAINLIIQLEILGFTVIQVPYFDLQNLEKKDVQSKMQYFENLLFRKETKTSQFNNN